MREITGIADVYEKQLEEEVPKCEEEHVGDIMVAAIGISIVILFSRGVRNGRAGRSGLCFSSTGVIYRECISS